MDDDLFFDNEDGGELPSQGVAPCSAFLAGPVLGEVALSGVDAQHESSLLRLLPPELLAALAGYLGPRASRHHPRCSPATFFQSCKMVHVLAKSTSTRVEFFVGTFGKAEIGDGMGDWLRLVTPEVLTAVFSRLRSCGEPIPRYQLQRLQRRLWIASRTDLLPIVMAHQAELYPGPPLQFRDRASFPYGTGASLTDSELFRLLVCWGRVPEGCEELVREGVKGGWADPNDSVITALRTLIRKYHLPIEHTSSGRSSLSQALFTVSLSNNVGRLQEPTFDPTFRIEPASDLRYDSYVPGTNAAHALLVQSAAAGNERAVRWLLQLGAPTVTSQITKGWFWNAMETWITLSEEETGGWNVAVENGTRAVEYVLGSRLVPQPPQQPCAVGRILNTLYRKHGVPSPYGHQHRAVGPLTPPRSSCEAVVTAAANGQLVTLRLILEHVQDRQGWDSQPGQKLLHQCLDLCQEQAACFNLIRSYCTTSANRVRRPGATAALGNAHSACSQWSSWRPSSPTTNQRPGT
ncbi:hypothetical protein DFJ74DRAFT_449388 [Hyaloraphidium curvatum]|nr:hypothetical protein DFJ74DRAFT_449388 [Hyaloraphidium curvatum]